MTDLPVNSVRRRESESGDAGYRAPVTVATRRH
jgi:hypothetical protein